MNRRTLPLWAIGAILLIVNTLQAVPITISTPFVVKQTLPAIPDILTVTPTGSVIVSGDHAVDTATTGWTINNSGTLRASGGAFDAINFPAVDGIITNLAGGVIDGERYGISVGGAGSSSVTNAGTITGGTNSIFFGTGGGTHTLTLQTGSVLNGDAIADGSTVALVLEGSGTEDSGFFFTNFFADGFNSLAMNGVDWTLTAGLFLAAGAGNDIDINTGKLTYSGFNTGDINVAAGATLAPGPGRKVITASGALNLDATSTLEISMDPQGPINQRIDFISSSGNIDITGRTLNIVFDSVPTPATLISGAEGDFLFAGGGGMIVGAFTLNAPPLVTITLSTPLANIERAELTAVAPLPSNNDIPSNQITGLVNQSVGEGGILGDALLEFYNSFDTGPIAESLRTFSPEAYNGLYPLFLKDSRNNSRDIFRRLAHLRALYRRYANEVPLLASTVEHNLILRNAMRRTRELSPHYCEWKGWAEMDYDYMTYQAESAFSGFKATGFTAHCGLDRYFSETTIIGADIAFNHNDIDWDSPGTCGNYYGFKLGGYTGYTYDNVFWDNKLTYGIKFVDLERQVNTLSTTYKICGDFVGHDINYSSQGGFGFDICGLSVAAIGGFDFVASINHCFEESGAGNLGMNLEMKCTESLKANAGLRLGWILERCNTPSKNFRVIMDATARWRYEFMDDHAKLAANFLGAAASSGLDGRRLGRHTGELGFTTTWLLNTRHSVFVAYDGELGDRYQVHSGSAGWHYSF